MDRQLDLQLVIILLLSGPYTHFHSLYGDSRNPRLLCPISQMDCGGHNRSSADLESDHWFLQLGHTVKWTKCCPNCGTQASGLTIILEVARKENYNLCPDLVNQNV